MNKFDFLVVGGGIAGLTYALEVAKKGSVAVLFKKELTDSSTSYAQGGIAAVQKKEDSFESHIEDTLVAGAGLVKKNIAEIVVKEAPLRVQELIARGAKFDLNQDGTGYDLHKEGGHSKRRILHNADATGWEIQRTLLEACKKESNIKFFTTHNAIDIITSYKLGFSNKNNNKALGLYVLTKNNEVQIFRAKKIMIATGGASKVYLYTSNPDVATGDGIAMCYRAGVPVANLEFFQFHPTCLYHPNAKNFLITEAMRGEGAILTRINGERFMPNYHHLAELAPRDIVARAIDNEMKMYGEDHVLLDIRHRGQDFIRQHFPNIYSKCISFGIDITQDAIPVVPAAHYCCGGVVCDEDGKTNIENLYVTGETSYSGLHGANRLASNSLLEGLVFASRAGKDSINNLENSLEDYKIPEWDMGNAVNSNEEIVISQNWDEIRRYMWNYVGIVRSDKRLERALKRSSLIGEEIIKYYWDSKLTPDLLELRNLSLVSDLIIRSAIKRKESRGLHFNIDHPNKNDEFLEDTILVNISIN